MALRVLAHLVLECWILLRWKTIGFDIRWCADDDDDTFYRELPGAEVIWHVLRPLCGDDLRRGTRLRLVQKLGAGPSVAEGTVLLMLAALGCSPGTSPGIPPTRCGAIWSRRSPTAAGCATACARLMWSSVLNSSG